MSLLKRCSDIELHLSSLLSQITVANGYETDIGIERVYRGKRKVESAELPCAVILTGEDRVGSQGRDEVQVDQDFVLGGYHQCDADQPNDVGHAIVRDIVKAVYKEGVNLGRRVVKVQYMGKDIGPRADSLPEVFAIVHITVTYSQELVAR